MRSILLLLLFFSLFANAQKRKYYDSLYEVSKEKTLTFLDLRDKDQVADIGTGTGYSLLPIAAANPSVIFHTEDIYSGYEKILRRKISKPESKVNISQFSFHSGTDTSIGMPAAVYSKVMLFDVLHEFSFKTKMLNEIKRISKEHASLFIQEILVHKKVKKDKGCNYPFLTETEMKDLMAENNFVLKREQYLFDEGKNRYIKIFEYTLK